MKKRTLLVRAAVLMLCLMMLSLGSAFPAKAEETASGAAVRIMEDAFEKMKEEARNDPQRVAEVTPVKTEITVNLPEYGINETGSMNVCTIEMDGHRMRYHLDIRGEADENGLYPLYIALHGGGTAPAEFNDMQWYEMNGYYSTSVENGIYVTPRGMEDVWNLHFLEESYPMYDRLIEDMVLLKNADPNRVYLLGFSAGGDGVYGVAPRMADRFAAVNMSSGHPNGISLLNTANLPILLQTGIRDFYSSGALRSIRNAEFESVLNEYQEKYGCPYPHRVLVHVPYGHNYGDYDGTGSGCVLKDPSEFALRAEAEDIPKQFCSLYLRYAEDEILETLEAHYREAYSAAVNTDTDQQDTTAPEIENDSAVTLDPALEKQFRADSIMQKLGDDPEDMDYIIDSLSYATRCDEFNAALKTLITDELKMEVTENENTNAVTWVSSFTRNPVPEKLVWDLSTRASFRKNTAYYWLRADFSVNSGIIEAAYDRETNTVTIHTDGNVNGSFSVLANPYLMDFDRPLRIITDSGEYTENLTADPETAARSLQETGDPFLAWMAEISVKGDGSL